MIKMKNNTFGKNMQNIRWVLDISQEELARRAGLQVSAISHFETGRRDPSLKNIRKICKGLGCSPNALIRL